MRLIAIRLAALSVLSCFALVAVAAGQVPVPPVKPGLWEARMSMLDADQGGLGMSGYRHGGHPRASCGEVAHLKAVVA